MPVTEIVKWLLNLFELAAAVTGFCYMYRWKNTHWRWLAWFLLFIVVTELTGKFLYHQPHLRKYNYMVYRYANLPVTVLFYLWIFYHAFKSRLMGRMVWLVGILYVVFWLVEEFWLPLSVRKGISRSYIFGFLGILALIITWFFRLVNSTQVVSYKRNMQFWVNTGLLLYIVTLTFSAMRTALYKKHPDVFITYWYISLVLTYFLYIFIIIGYKWAEPKASYSL